MTVFIMGLLLLKTLKIIISKSVKHKNLRNVIKTILSTTFIKKLTGIILSLVLSKKIIWVSTKISKKAAKTNIKELKKNL